MESIFQIKQKAKAFRKNGQYQEGMELYRILWNEHRDSCNEWDAWGFAACLRKIGNSKEALEICRTLYKMKSNFKQGKDLYAWCIFDTEICKDDDSIGKNERKFYKAVKAIEELTIQDKYSPYTQTIFTVIDYLIRNRQSFPAKEISNWLEKLDRNKLSDEAYSFVGDDGKRVELQSQKEKWYANKTKTLEKLGECEECICFCNEALEKIPALHNSNEIWFKRRIAISNSKLGKMEEAADSLKRIVTFKKDWFIYFELANIIFELGNNEEAFKYAIESALSPGKKEYKWKLFLLLARILDSQGRIDQAKKHLKYVLALRKEQNWKIPNDVSMLIEKHNIDLSKIEAAQLIHKDLKIIWQSEKLSGLPAMNGKIKKIMANGKIGFISGNDGIDYFFKMSDLKGNKAKIERGLKVSFLTTDSFDRKKGVNSKAAINISINSQKR